MASHLFLLFSFVVLFLHLFSLVQSGEIATYWGQNVQEGRLRDACSTGSYQIINIGFLNVFGGGQEPSLNLTRHCDPRSLLLNSCTGLSQDIRFCQSRDVKVLLSIGGPNGIYSLATRGDARKLATYLWNNFLGGATQDLLRPRPLGNAILDGIDFHIESGHGLLWDELAKFLTEFRSQRPVVLSAAPGCSFPDARLNTALETNFFDYVWVRFYDNEECQYPNIGRFMDRWSAWDRFNRLPRQVFLGLPAAPEAVASNGGYIPPGVLIGNILRQIRSTQSYGGIMLWNRFYDLKAGYSNSIRGAI